MTNKIETIQIQLPQEHEVISQEVSVDVTELKLDIYKSKGLDISELSNCTKLETLELSSPGYSWECVEDFDLNQIARISNLKTLVLSRLTKLQILDLQPLIKLESLEALTISNIETLKNIDFSPLSELKKLSTLILDSNKLLTRIDLSKLSILSALTTLVVEYHTNLECLDLGFLSSFEKLEHLDISSNKLSHIDFEPLRECTNLRHLDISNNELNHIDLEFLRGCTNLRHLDISHNAPEHLDLSVVEDLQNLEFLDISGGMGPSQIDLSPLPTCKSLREFIISLTYPTPYDIEPLSRCESLETLRFGGRRETFGGAIIVLDLSTLTTSKSLKNLSVGASWTLSDLTLPIVDSLEIVSIRVDYLQTLTLSNPTKQSHLREIEISSSISDLNLETLSGCGNLKEISIVIRENARSVKIPGPPNLEKMKIKQEKHVRIIREHFDLTALSGCTKLSSLIFEGFTRFDIDTSFLKGTTSLEYIRLIHTGTIDMTVFSSCKNLQELDLSTHELDSLSLTPLGKCRKLKRFTLKDDNLVSLNLKPLSKIPTLVFIWIRCIKLKDISFSNMPSLTSIRIEGSLTSIDLETLSESKQLEEITLTKNKIAHLDLTPFSGFQQLEWINLEANGIEEIKLPSLPSGSKLRTLNLKHNNLSKLDLTPLKNCKLVETLNLNGNRLQELISQALPSWTELKTVEISSGTELSEIDLSFIKGATKLETFELWGRYLNHLNLSPLSECIALEKLKLYSTGLESIELTPLSNCINLRTFEIWGNRKLKSLNLKPLAGCKNLQSITLKGNGLTSIDLKPLSELKKLRVLDLADNAISKIVLRPLSSCTNLRILKFYSKKLKSFNTDPIFFLPVLDPFDPPKKGSLDPLYRYRSSSWYSWIRCIETKPKSQLIKKYPKYHSWSHLADEITWTLSGNSHRKPSEADKFEESYHILSLFGLAEFWGYGGSVVELIRKLDAGTSYKDAKIQLETMLIEELEEHIENKGPTIFLNIEKLAMNPNTIYLVKPILQRRQEEIEETVIPVVNNKAYIRFLWVTAYGFRVLSALGYENTTDAYGLGLITKQFKELGVELKTIVKKSSDGKYVVDLPTGMKEFVTEVSKGKRPPMIWG